ncbi:hypothetical protein ACFPZ0_21770 [Streptomonospora nanhaiensis]|uniref:Uncharacterized protein n=1 Tax=Streptomonospora nanhaiensis TaxID=1323731 RepID=A0A853BT68_9ACTN|nr:hypothetical protein [Streptomonospora nanhaiensis]MBV2366044.1 hypothetical protein [Streptomonospora nanhaiensis]MBX9390456.1 hypothetical protein [Streptomonospora nanhaiensis]NYI97701.1 hypothetical protein [Streptomonospora nanhaiensis]
MRTLFSALAAVALTGALTLLPAGAAHAATGEVVVFKTEVEDLDVHENPAPGCYSLPGTAHVLINRTDTDVVIHGNSLCFGPGITVPPNRGWHAPPGGLDGVFAFSVR